MKYDIQDTVTGKNYTVDFEGDAPPTDDEISDALGLVTQGDEVQDKSYSLGDSAKAAVEGIRNAFGTAKGVATGDPESLSNVTTGVNQSVLKPFLDPMPVMQAASDKVVNALGGGSVAQGVGMLIPKSPVDVSLATLPIGAVQRGLGKAGQIAEATPNAAMSALKSGGSKIRRIYDAFAEELGGKGKEPLIQPSKDMFMGGVGERPIKTIPERPYRDEFFNNIPEAPQPITPDISKIPAKKDIPNKARIDLTNYFKRDVNELYKNQQKVFGEQLQKELASNPDVEVDMSNTIKRIAQQKKNGMLEPSLGKVINENPELRKMVSNELNMLNEGVDTTDYVYSVYGKDISKTLSRLSQLSTNKSSVMYPARELAREFSLGVSEKLPGLQQARAEYADFMSYYDKLKNMSGQAITKGAKSGSFASPEVQAAYDKVVTGGVKDAMAKYKQISQEVDDFNRSVDDMMRNGTPEQRTAFQKAYDERISALKSAKGEYEQAMKEYHVQKKTTHRDYQTKKKDWQGKVNQATEDYAKAINDYKLKMHRKSQNDRIMKTVGVTAATALGLGGLSRLTRGAMSIGD